MASFQVRSCLVGALLAQLITLGSSAGAAEKNVILMVADGAGYNTWAVTSMYQGRWNPVQQRSSQAYDGPGWVAYACTTFPLNTATAPRGTGVQDAAVVYDPRKAWGGLEAYQWLSDNYTDSAAAATALSTGQKSYNNAINWSDRKQPIRPTLTEAAKAAGKSVGIVTTVAWSHATPAAMSHVHNADRDNYVEIANQMLDGEWIDVIMGAGNPDYDNDGMPVTGKKKEYKYVGGESTWRAIEAARSRPGATYRGFRPVSTKAEFESLVSGRTPPKVLGTAQAGTTLQQARRAKNTADPALDTPLNSHVPTLATMAEAAINILDENPRGFFLMVEGGAVDFANHNQQAGRMVQEHADFLAAVEMVVEWVETRSNWQETLLIITADHETGLLWGPRSDKVPFEPIVTRGAGRMPALKYNSKKHSNSLVPVFARGAGSELLGRLVQGTDPIRGPYIDNTAIGKVLLSALGAGALAVSGGR